MKPILNIEALQKDFFNLENNSSYKEKTVFCLNACKDAQKKGYYIIYIDSNGNFNIDSLKAFGLDLSKFRIEPIFSIEKFKIYMSKLLDKLEKSKQDGFTIPKLFFVLDSIDNFYSNLTVDDIQSNIDNLIKRLLNLTYSMIILSHNNLDTSFLSNNNNLTIY